MHGNQQEWDQTLRRCKTFAGGTPFSFLLPSGHIRPKKKLTANGSQCIRRKKRQQLVLYTA